MSPDKCLPDRPRFRRLRYAHSRKHATRATYTLAARTNLALSHCSHRGRHQPRGLMPVYSSLPGYPILSGSLFLFAHEEEVGIISRIRGREDAAAPCVNEPGRLGLGGRSECHARKFGSATAGGHTLAVREQHG